MNINTYPLIVCCGCYGFGILSAVMLGEQKPTEKQLEVRVFYVTNTVHEVTIREVPAPLMPSFPFTVPNTTNWIFGTPVPAPIYGLYTNGTLRIEAGPYMTTNGIWIVPDGGAK